MSKAKRLKVYGPSNDAIPEEELIAAKLIAYTKAKGWFACREHGYMYGAEGKCIAVCALGAAVQSKTTLDWYSYSSVACGNDGKFGGDGPGYDIGAAFFEVCRMDQ